MEDISRKLIASIKKDKIYTGYRRARKAVASDPVLMQRIGEMREETIRLYRDPGDRDLAGVSAEIRSKYEDLFGRPEVNAYLEAEEALVGLIRSINADLLTGMGFILPPEDREKG